MAAGIGGMIAIGISVTSLIVSIYNTNLSSENRKDTVNKAKEDASTEYKQLLEFLKSTVEKDQKLTKATFELEDTGTTCGAPGYTLIDPHHKTRGLRIVPFDATKSFKIYKLKLKKGKWENSDGSELIHAKILWSILSGYGRDKNI